MGKKAAAQDRITARLSPAIKGRIRFAAELVGQSITEYMIGHAVQAADVLTRDYLDLILRGAIEVEDPNQWKLESLGAAHLITELLRLAKKDRITDLSLLPREPAEGESMTVSRAWCSKGRWQRDELKVETAFWRWVVPLL